MKAKVSLSFDDGRKDNIEVARKLLFPMGVTATFNITTGYVDGTIPMAAGGGKIPCDKPAMSIDDVIWLHENGFEIALHGDRHMNTAEDNRICRRKLIDWLQLNNEMKFGFASPMNGMDLEYFYSEDFFNQYVDYIAIGPRYRYRFIDKVIRHIIRLFSHNPWIAAWSELETIMTEKYRKQIFRIAVSKDTDEKMLEQLVLRAIRNDGCLSFMFHSIIQKPAANDRWAYDYDAFQKFCIFLDGKQKSGQIQVCTTKCLFSALS